MEVSELIGLLTTNGLAIVLVLYYVLKINPEQNKRYDAMVDKMMASQAECADKMNKSLTEVNQALRDNSKSIEKLHDLIQEKIK